MSVMKRFKSHGTSGWQSMQGANDLPEGARKSNEGGAFAQPTVVGQQQALAVRPALP